jgi:NADH-quinone oxidoreductase subunit N
VAHAGYALLGVFGDPQRATPALLYYVLTYALTVLGAFGVIAIVESGTRSLQISGLAGLGTRSPLLASTLTVFVLSLAGIPPLAGFFGKFYVFVNASKAGGSLGYFWLVLVALATSCVSLYYYLQVLKQVWVIAPEAGSGETQARLVPPSFATRTVLLALAAGVILLGCFPQWLISGLQ